MTAEQERAAVVAEREAWWPYFIGPVLFCIVWSIAGFWAAWWSIVGMLIGTLFCLHEVGRKLRGDHLARHDQGEG